MSHPSQPRSSGPGTIDWYGESRAITKLMREKEELKQQLATARAGFDAAERRIADLELRVRVLTQSLMEAAQCSGPPARS